MLKWFTEIFYLFSFISMLISTVGELIFHHDNELLNRFAYADNATTELQEQSDKQQGIG